MDQLLTPVALGSLGYNAAVTVMSLLAGFSLAARYRIGRVDAWVLVWLVYDAVTHFVLEGSFVYMCMNKTVDNSTGPLAGLWQEYARADRRWGSCHETIVSMEILTVVVDGVLCVLLARAVLKHSATRHWLQIVLCTAELYGGWMTFCPEWLTGSPNLATSNPLYLWCYLVFFNGIWVVVPGLMLYQSWIALSAGAAGSRSLQARPPLHKRD